MFYIRNLYLQGITATIGCETYPTADYHAN